MARKRLSVEEYAAKLEALCAKPQWTRRRARVLRNEFHMIHGGDPSSRPDERWRNGEDGPLSKWGGSEDEQP